MSADSNVISNPQSSSVFQATINNTYDTEESAQARESKEVVDIDSSNEVDLDNEDLAHFIEQAKVLEK